MNPNPYAALSLVLALLGMVGFFCLTQGWLVHSVSGALILLSFVGISIGAVLNGKKCL